VNSGTDERRRGTTPQKYAALAYVAVALLVAGAFLPSILRPPPAQTSDSAALNPGAPPDDQSDAVIQASKQASGAGAGASTGNGPGSSGGGPPASTTTLPPPKAFAQCYGSPARQIESVYAAPCAPAWSGDNGGATAKNVFPNEVRISLWHGLAEATYGRINPQPQPGEKAVDRTLRVLEVYMNAHYQTYGRHVSFYGGQEGGTTPEEQEAEGQSEIDNFKIFGAWHLDKPFCEVVASVGPVICNPFEHSEFLRYRPNFYSFMMDIDQSNGLAAELICKKLVGKPAQFAGTGVDRTAIRKFGLMAEDAENVNQSTDSYNKAMKAQCGRTADYSYAVDFTRQENTSTAIAQMKQNGVTTVLLDTLGGDTAQLMASADALGWQPEWVIMGNYGLDLNNFALTFPRTQSQHVFGINTWELPHPFEQWECEQAYKTIDPANAADQSTCQLYWHPIVVLMNMIQEAGPKLTPKAVQDGMVRVGHHFYTDPQWAIGGGFGPDDFSYMDDVGVVWYSNSRIDPETGRPGAYVWTDHGHRFQKGQFTDDISQLFHSGVTGPGQPDTVGP
jgi:hypothetical protein